MTGVLKDSTLKFPEADRSILEPYLPQHHRQRQTKTDTKNKTDDNNNNNNNDNDIPFTTLTFATSLDSSLSISPGIPTALSGPQSKAMTHYLRSRHDAILIGVGTAVADNPSLNCRIYGVSGYGYDGHDGGDSSNNGRSLYGQPRPIILDPTARFEVGEETKILALAREGKGLAPFIITGVMGDNKNDDDKDNQVQSESGGRADSNSARFERQKRVLEEHGGKYIQIPLGLGSSSVRDGSENRPVQEDEAEAAHKLDWRTILRILRKEGLESVMIEGGGMVINSLLEPSWHSLIDSVIVTIAPTWLGRGGVVVSPSRRFGGDGKVIPASRLRDVRWYPFGEDVVLCGKMMM